MNGEVFRGSLTRNTRVIIHRVWPSKTPVRELCDRIKTRDASTRSQETWAGMLGLAPMAKCKVVVYAQAQSRVIRKPCRNVSVQCDGTMWYADSLWKYHPCLYSQYSIFLDYIWTTCTYVHDFNIIK